MNAVIKLAYIFALIIPPRFCIFCIATYRLTPNATRNQWNYFLLHRKILEIFYVMKNCIRMNTVSILTIYYFSSRPNTICMSTLSLNSESSTITVLFSKYALRSSPHPFLRTKILVLCSLVPS